MSEEIHYHSDSKGEDIPLSEMSDTYVRRALKKMIIKDKSRFDKKEKITNLTTHCLHGWFHVF